MRLLVGLAGVLWTSSSFAAEDAYPNFAWCLDSGLRVILEPDPSRPEVRFETVIEGGSAGESPEEAGLAHLVEHLWFRSAPSFVETDVYTTVGGRGGRLNATTRRDVTTFTTIAPRASARVVLQLEAARLADPLTGVDDTIFATEQAIVLNEHFQRYSDTSSSVIEPLYAALFPAEHPYHHLPSGDEASIAGLTLDAARAYVAKWYRPEHTTLHISGDFTEEALGRLLPQIFPGAATPSVNTPLVQGCGARPFESIDLPPVEAGRLPDYEAAVARPQLVFGWRFPADEAVPAAFDVAVAESTLSAALRRSVDCHFLPARRGGLGWCEMPALREAPELSHAVAMKALAQNWELNRRASLQNAFFRWRQEEAVAIHHAHDEGRRDPVVQGFHVTGRQDWLDAWWGERRLVGGGRLVRVGRDHMGPGQTAWLVVQPSEGGDAGAAPHGDREAEGFAAVQPGSVDVAFLDRVIGEPSWDANEQVTFKNGLTFTIVPLEGTRFVKAGLFFPGGRALEPLEGVDLLTWRMLRNPSRGEQEAAFELLGSWSIARALDLWVYRVDGLSVVPLLDLLLTHWQEQIPKGSVKKSLEALESHRETAADRAYEAREGALLGRWARSRQERLEALAALKKSDVRRWAKRHLDGSGAHLVLVGAVDAAAVRAVATDRYRPLRTKPADRSPRRVSVDPPDAQTIPIEDDVARKQVTVALGCRLAGTEGTAELTAQLVQDRLWTELRAQKGLTYGVSAARHRDLAGERLDLVTDVQRDGLDTAVEAIRRVLAELAADGPTEEALSAARLARAGAIADQLQSSESVFLMVGQHLARGGALEDFGGFAEDLMAVDAEAVSAALETCAGHEVITLRGTNLGAR